jgi:ABC-type uncharacterized transport system permease subunit
MIHLIVTQLLFASAAIAAWRSAKTATADSVPVLLLALAVVSALLLWPQGANDAFASAAMAAVLTSALWLLLNVWRAAPIAGGLSALASFLTLLPLHFVDANTATSTEPLTLSTLLHIIAAGIAFAAFTLSALQSVVVVWLSMQIKQHRLGAYPGAGSLEDNERAWLGLTQVAWWAVLLAILSGIPSVYDVLSQHLSHKIFFAVLAWLLLSALLLGRRYRGWREKTAARWVVGGWLALWVAWLGTKLVLQSLQAG